MCLTCSPEYVINVLNSRLLHCMIIYSPRPLFTIVPRNWQVRWMMALAPQFFDCLATAVLTPATDAFYLGTLGDRVRRRPETWLVLHLSASLIRCFQRQFETTTPYFPTYLQNFRQHHDITFGCCGFLSSRWALVQSARKTECFGGCLRHVCSEFEFQNRYSALILGSGYIPNHIDVS